MPDDAFALTVAVVAYLAGSSTRFDLPDGASVSAAAAFGPALVALASGGLGATRFPAILLVAALARVGLAALVRPLRISVSAESIALFLAAIAFDSLAATLTRYVRTDVAIAGAVVLCAAVYPTTGLLIGIARGGRSSIPRALSGIRASSLVYLVLASTGALVVLCYTVLGPASFLMLLAPLYFVRREFANYRAAASTYTETVGALGRLVETAGLAPAGHHECVSTLCGLLAEEIGLSPSRTRRLVLAAGLHDIGAISSDGDVALDSSSAQRSGKVLAETEYLAPLAEVIEGADEGASHSTESQIFRIAHWFDGAARHDPSPASDEAEVARLADPEVVAAFGRVVNRLAALRSGAPTA